MLHSRKACENKLHFLYDGSISNVIFLALQEFPLTLISSCTVRFNFYCVLIFSSPFEETELLLSVVLISSPP